MSNGPSDFWSKYVPSPKRSGMPNVSQAAARTKPRVSGNRVKYGEIPGASMPKTRAYVPPALQEIPNVSPPRASHLSGMSRRRVPNSAGIPDRLANVDALLRATRASLARAKRASECLTTEKPDAQYDTNKIKWCATICQEAKLACRFSDQSTETESHPPSIRVQKVIDEFYEEFLQAFSSLFS